jgi:DNA-binding MarR family transcriptional regulator
MVDSKHFFSEQRARALREAIELFYFGYRAFTEGPDRILAQRGLGRVHHRILYFVGRNPDIHVGGLLTILAVSKQALHAPLRQLIEMGLIEDRAASTDKRQKQLRLTHGGEQLEARLSETQMQWLDAHLSAAGPQAEKRWFAVMQALAEAEPSAQLKMKSKETS